ncbi:MAG: DDE-type integrase/transposase/recombinase [Steroidobacteraceae bacterium]
MEDPRRRDIGLFRYSIAREPAEPRLTKAERGEIVRALAEQVHTDPDGREVRLGRSTIDRWVRQLRRGGFEALVPAPRNVAARTDAALLGLAETLKREAPARTAAQVVRIIGATGVRAPSERTVQRLYARLGLYGSNGGSPPRAYGRFEAKRPNELWMGDALHGPVVGGKKAYLLAFLDDYSRALTGYRWTYSEDTVRLEAALRQGLASRGVPEAILVDRGSAYVSPELARSCAVLGIRLVHARARTPTTKGKIERFFRSMRAQFLVEIESRPAVADLSELNRLFEAFVEVVYHRQVHSETKATPLARFLENGPPSLPSPAELHEAFLWSAVRVVSKTSQVSLLGNSFEVDAALVGRKAELAFDPFDLTEIEVRYEGRPMGMAVPVHICRHVHPKARPEAAPPPVPSGIDYLGLLTRKREAELAGRHIDYAALKARTEAEQDQDNDEEDEQ